MPGAGALIHIQYSRPLHLPVIQSQWEKYIQHMTFTCTYIHTCSCKLHVHVCRPPWHICWFPIPSHMGYNALLPQLIPVYCTTFGVLPNRLMPNWGSLFSTCPNTSMADTWIEATSKVTLGLGVSTITCIYVHVHVYVKHWIYCYVSEFLLAIEGPSFWPHWANRSLVVQLEIFPYVYDVISNILFMHTWSPSPVRTQHF